MVSKRILVLTTFYRPFIGGAEISTEEFLKRLKNQFNFTIFTAKTNSWLPSKEIDGDIVIYRLGFGCKFDKYFFPVFAFVKSFSVDFDYSYAVMATYSGMTALLLKIFRGKPYVLNLQSGTLVEKLKRKKFFWAKLVCRQIHVRADYIQTISRSLSESAVELGALPEKIFIVPNGVSDDFKPMKNGNSKRIIVVSRLERIKGVKYLIGAMPLVLAKFPDAELLVVGNGSERRDIGNLIGYLGIEKSIKLLGERQRNEIPQLMNSGVIFVMPSLAEGLGVACLEAMACGLAAIGTRVGGILDIIQDGYNGLLADPASSEDLAEKIIYLLTNNEKREAYSAKGLEFISNYTWDKVSANLAGVFDRVKI